jgi:hypothetical protein
VTQHDPGYAEKAEAVEAVNLSRSLLGVEQLGEVRGDGEGEEYFDKLG